MSEQPTPSPVFLRLPIYRDEIVVNVAAVEFVAPSRVPKFGQFALAEGSQVSVSGQRFEVPLTVGEVEHRMRTALGSAGVVMGPEIEDRHIAEMNLSVRATNVLENAGIHTLHALMSTTEGELLCLKNFGQTTLEEIRQKLGDLGVGLRGEARPRPAAPCTQGDC